MRDYPTSPHPKYDKAIFLDRDGTINKDTHYPHRVEDLVILDGTLDALRILASLRFEIIVVTNQSGIGLNLYQASDMSRFNEELRKRVEWACGRIDAFYFCPHKEASHLQPYEIACLCSKPSPGLLLEAADEFHIDLQRSYMIGDKSSDVVAGQRAGCKSILVLTGNAGKEENAVSFSADFVASDLLEAAQIVSRLQSPE